MFIFSLLQLGIKWLLNQQEEETIQLQKRVRLVSVYRDINLKIWSGWRQWERQRRKYLTDICVHVVLHSELYFWYMQQKCWGSHRSQSNHKSQWLRQKKLQDTQRWGLAIKNYTVRMNDQLQVIGLWRKNHHYFNINIHVSNSFYYGIFKASYLQPNYNPYHFSYLW